MFRLIFPVLLIIWCLVIFTLLRRVPKVGWLLALLLTAGLLTPFVFGPIWDLGPKVPHLLLNALSLLTVTALVLCLIQVGVLLVRLVLRLFWPAASAALASPAMACTIVAVGCVLGVWGFYQAAKVPDVKRMEITLPGLPAAFDGFTMVQLSDTHVGLLYNRAWLEAVVEKTNALKADAIVVTGDVGEAPPQEVADQLAPLKNLHAPDGVYFILGNHETYQGLNNWLSYYKNEGFTLLRNSHAQLERQGEYLVFGGLDLAARGFPANTMNAESNNQPDVIAAFAGSHEGATRILLDHLPQNAIANSNHNIALQLSGHTHGGQIPPIVPLVKRANSGFYSGLYQVGSMTLYVSNGTGLWSNMPIRLGAPSEITYITLRKPAEN